MFPPCCAESRHEIVLTKYFMTFSMCKPKHALFTPVVSFSLWGEIHLQKMCVHFMINITQSCPMWCWKLLSGQFAFGVTEIKKVKDYIMVLRIVLWDKYLHLPSFACQCVCFVAVLSECWSPTVPPQRPISLLCLRLLNEIFALQGARWRRGVWAITCLTALSFLSPPVRLSLPLFLWIVALSALLFVSFYCIHPTLSWSIYSFVSSVCF